MINKHVAPNVPVGSLRMTTLESAVKCSDALAWIALRLQVGRLPLVKQVLATCRLGSRSNMSGVLVEPQVAPIMAGRR
jgi:hypothetical protein